MIGVTEPDPNQTVLQDPFGVFALDRGNQPPFVATATASAGGPGGSWLQKNSTAVFVIAAALFALALLGGRHR